jgi:hypothetical protein
MAQIEEIESALSNLYGIVFNLRIQNEVNKVMINALKSSLLHEKIETIDAQQHEKILILIRRLLK